MHAQVFTSADRARRELAVAEYIAQQLGVPNDRAFEQPAVLTIRAEKATITQAQVLSIKHELSLQSAQGQPRWVVVFDAQTLGRESANAMLKLLEEPPEMTNFLLTAPSVAQLLPTIRSRVAVVPVLGKEMHLSADSSARIAASEILAGNAPVGLGIISQWHTQKKLAELQVELMNILHDQSEYVTLDWLRQFQMYLGGVPNRRLLLETLVIFRLQARASA